MVGYVVLLVEVVSIDLVEKILGIILEAVDRRGSFLDSYK